MKALKRSPDFDRTRRGMTLIEVILGIAILAILAVLGATALFYPRYLVVTSALEQNAIHAGSAEIERHLHNYNVPANLNLGQFNIGGWGITGADRTTTTNVITETISGTVGDDCEYLEIITTITYRGKQVDLVTYRSREVISSQRQAQ